MNSKKIIPYIIVFLFLAIAGNVSAQQPRLVFLQQGDVQISNPETSQLFYDNLNGKPRDYFIDSGKDFELYINLLVPEAVNRNGRYSANIFLLKDNATEQIASIDGTSFDWQRIYKPFDRDYYLKGPEFSKQLPAGKYKIEVYSKDNQGKYVLAVGKTETYDIQSVLNIYWQLPFLKLTFSKTSVLQFFLTPFGIAGIGALGALLIFLAFLNYLIGLIKGIIRHNQAKTLLLTSAGMQMKSDIIKLLQKPAYDVTVAFITTAAKPQENLDYLKRDWEIMKEELRFNIEEIDIDGKTESQVMKLLELKDIIFVEGGNTFYLLKSMRACNFEKVIRKLLKQGKVYIGASAGSIVAGRTIKTAGWDGDKNAVKLKNLKGLNLVPFDIFVHYQPEYAEIIKKEIKNPKKRAKKLRILTDQQAILVQGKEIDLIGEGEAIII
jgi:dipeptidase E